MLIRCSATMAPCSEMLLGIALALAADEWTEVARPCRAYLAGDSTAEKGPSQRQMVAGVISKLVLGLADAARGNEDAFILHARRLSTALQVSVLCRVMMFVLQECCRKVSMHLYSACRASRERFLVRVSSTPLPMHAGSAGRGCGSKAAAEPRAAVLHLQQPAAVLRL